MIEGIGQASLALEGVAPNGTKIYKVFSRERLSDAQVGRLIGTTKPTIQAIRDRSHWNSSNLRPRSPVELGLCRQEEMSIEIQKAIKAGRKPLEKPIQETFEEEPKAAPGWEGLE